MKNMDYLSELKKLKEKMIVKIAVTILIFIGFIILLYLAEEDKTHAIKHLIILLLIGTLLLKTIIQMFIIRKDKQAYTKIYKDNIVSKCLKNKFENVDYKPTIDSFEGEQLPHDFVNVLGNIKIKGGISYNDYISAKSNEIAFQFADVEMTNEYRNKDDGYHGEYTTFKGQWFVIESKSLLKENIQIIDKRFKGNKKNGLLSNKKYKKLNGNFNDINKYFEIFFEENANVTNIITSDFVKQLSKIKETLKSKIFICIMSGKLYILLDSKIDFFKPCIFSKFDEKEEKEKISNQIEYIVNIIDSMVLIKK